MPKEDHIVTYICKRWVKLVVSAFKRRKWGGRKSSEQGTEGVVTGRVRSESSRTGQALGWPGLAGVPFQELNSASVLVLCNGAGGSDPLAHDECGGGLLPYVVWHSLRQGDGAVPP